MITLDMIFSIAALVVSAFSVLYMLYANGFRKKEAERQNRAVMSYVRDRLERQIYRLNERLVDTEAKWLDVNHLIVSSFVNSEANRYNHSSNPLSLDNHSFFKQMGVQQEDLQVNRDKVFVLMPYHQDFDDMYISIKNACVKHNLNCIRGDEQYIRGSIISHVIKNISSSCLIICLLDGRNPNVYYELGLAHAMDKNVILLTSELNNATTDIKSNKLVFFDSYYKLEKNLEKEIARFLEDTA